MSKLLNMVQMVISSFVGGVGTGNLNLGAAQAGYDTISGAGGVNSGVYSYSIQEGVKWEYGKGTYTSSGTVFARTVVIRSSAGTATAETFTTSALLVITPLREDFDAIDLTPVAKGSVSSGTATFDVSKGAVQTITNGGAHTLAFSNWATGYSEIEILYTNAGAFTITLPTVNWVKGDGTKSTTFSTMGVTLQASGTNTFLFWSSDGGTTVYGKAA